MKDNFVNMFWAIIWAIVLGGTIAGIFWKWGLYIVIVMAAIMVGMFVYDYIKVSRLK